MNRLLLLATLLAPLAGCIASGGVGYRATVVTPAPPPPPPPEPVYVEPAPAVEVAYVEPAAYVYINPNVQVIEDYDYPVFFSGGLYWRQEGGVWYSSSYHDRGWYASADVPVYIRTIDRPTQYVHYRADVHARAGQPGSRFMPPAPVRHPSPPPRYVDQPGRPVREPAPGGRPEPHPMQPAEPAHPAHPVHPMEPRPEPPPMHAAPVEPGRGEPGRPAPHPMQPAEPAHPVHPMEPRPEPPPMHAVPVEPGRPAPPPVHAAPVQPAAPAQHPAPRPATPSKHKTENK